MIPFNCLNRDQKEIELIENQLSHFIKNGSYILGEQLEEFEKAFSAYTGIEHAIGVNSGTDAIYMILKSNAARSVGVCSSAPLPCAQAIMLTGAIPVFIDTYMNTGLIDIDDLLRKIPEIDTLLAVHLYGRPERLDELSEICTKKNILIVEDCSQSVGTKYKGKHTGYNSIASAFSFYPTKNLGGMGDGGMVMTHDAKMAGIMRSMRNYGIRNDYSAAQFGLNTRLDPIQAVILSERLKTLDYKTARRRSILDMYRNNIRNSLISLPDDGFFTDANGHIMPVFCNHRDVLSEYMKKNGVMTGVHYPVPLHKQPYFDSGKSMQNAERLANTELSIPVFPEITADEIDLVIETLNRFIV